MHPCGNVRALSFAGLLLLGGTRARVSAEDKPACAVAIDPQVTKLIQDWESRLPT